MAEFIRDKAGATEAQQKKALAFLFAQDSVGLATDGVLSGLQVTQTGTASANVLVGAGAAVTQDTVGNGASLMVNDTQKTLDVLTANPMGATARNDLVVFDSATASIRVIVGTPNVSPTDPTVPATATALARLRHAASATTVPTAKIDDLRTFTGMAEYAPPWTSLTLAGGVSGTLKYRLRGAMVDVAVDVTGTFAAGFTAISSGGALPAAARPSITPARAVAYVGSGTVQGSIEVLTTGTINVQCDASRTLAKTTFSYPAG